MKLLYISGLVIIGVLLFPFLVLRQNSCFLIHDNLDGELVYLHVLKITGQLFSLRSDTIIPNVMNGLPRFAYHSEFSFVRVLFYLLPSFWAYVVNFILVRIIGFVGMYLFAKDYLLQKSNPKLIIAFAALFSIIPLYAIYGISVMGQPLLVWAFLNLSYDRRSYVNWLIIALFPFYSHFALIAPFILSVLFVYGAYRFLRKDSPISNSYFIGLGLLLLSFVIANCQTLYHFVSPGTYISHRTEWTLWPAPFKDMVHETIYLFFNGQYHSSSFNAKPIYALALIGLFYVRRDRRKVMAIIGAVFLIAVLTAFWASYSTFCYYTRNQTHIFTVFQFRRFTFLIPFIWFVILGFSIENITGKARTVLICGVFILTTLLIIRENPEMRCNYARIFFKNDSYPSFKSFFAEDIFKNIAATIGKPKSDYRVVSIGLHPSIAQYNGFYTLDSYQNNYPLEYKHEFRKIIAGELDKDERLRKYFDDWGSRCYVYSSELYNIEPTNMAMVNIYKNTQVQIRDLSINTAQLKAMGAEYIFSAVPITNAEQLKIRLINKFSDPQATWDIYLYKL